MCMIYLGLEVAADETKRTLIDRRNLRDKSFFHLGFELVEVKVALTRDLDFNVYFYSSI